MLITFILAIAAIIFLGVIAGFSPILYIAHFTAASETKRYLAYTTAIMGGVLGAVVTLVILFQLFQLETLLSFINTTLKAIIIHVIFNGITGVALIIGGFMSLHRQKPVAPKAASHKVGGINALAGLGFARTITSVSTVVATYAAGVAIATVSIGLLDHFIYSIVFLAATIAPFLLIVLLARKHPEKLQRVIKRLKASIQTVNYRALAGKTAIAFGAGIIIVPIITAFIR